VHGFGYDLYRVGARLNRGVRILSGTEATDICDEGRDVVMEPDGFRIDYTAFAPASFRRKGVLHYKIIANQPRRIAPVALTPQDFVDEWLHRPWSDARNWSRSGNQKTLHAVHTNLQRINRVETYYGPVTRCSGDTLWQVRAGIGGIETRYFLIRETAPHDYLMAAARKTRESGCR
jgi:hypothetical protein